LGHSLRKPATRHGQQQLDDRAIPTPAADAPAQTFLVTTSKTSVDPGFSAVKTEGLIERLPFGTVCTQIQHLAQTANDAVPQPSGERFAEF